MPFSRVNDTVLVCLEQPRIDAPGGFEDGMASRLRDCAILHHNYVLNMLDGGETMSNNHHCSPRTAHIQGFLHNLFRRNVLFGCGGGGGDGVVNV